MVVLSVVPSTRAGSPVVTALDVIDPPAAGPDRALEPPPDPNPDAVTDIIACGQENDRDIRAGQPDPADHLETVAIRHHHVQQDQVRRRRRHGAQRFRATRRGRHLEPGEPERSG
jgi:hypothetical protein